MSNPVRDSSLTGSNPVRNKPADTADPEKKVRATTLVLICTDAKILLGMKKRGFGAGRWNGFGGKVRQDESVKQAAERETLEEAGITPVNLKKRGTLVFHIEEEHLHIEVMLFSASEFEGEPHETEEMRPQWFSFDEIPYETMWADDIHWLPLVLAGKNIRGEFYFSDIDTLTNYSVQEF